MFKHLLPALICLFTFSAANAQSKKAASYFKSGIQFRNNNQFAEALGEFNKAISFNKKFDSAYVEIGNIYSKGGSIDNGLINYKKALAINPKYTDALIGMGKLYRDARQNLDSAIIFYNAAVKLDSTNKETFYALAWIYNAKKEYEKAIPYAVKSLEIDNTYKPSYGELGHAYRITKKYNEAIEQFKKNLAVSVVDVALLYSGYCYTELNDKEGALQQYEALKKVNEKMAGALMKKIDFMK